MGSTKDESPPGAASSMPPSAREVPGLPHRASRLRGRRGSAPALPLGFEDRIPTPRAPLQGQELGGRERLRARRVPPRPAPRPFRQPRPTPLLRGRRAGHWTQHALTLCGSLPQAAQRGSRLRPSSRPNRHSRRIGQSVGRRGRPPSGCVRSTADSIGREPARPVDWRTPSRHHRPDGPEPAVTGGTKNEQEYVVKKVLLGVLGIVGALLDGRDRSAALGLDTGQGLSSMAAKTVCSAAFVAGRATSNDLFAEDVLPASPVLAVVATDIDEGSRSVTARFLDVPAHGLPRDRPGLRSRR